MSSALAFLRMRILVRDYGSEVDGQASEASGDVCCVCFPCFDFVYRGAKAVMDVGRLGRDIPLCFVEASCSGRSF